MMSMMIKTEGNLTVKKKKIKSTIHESCLLGSQIHNLYMHALIFKPQNQCEQKTHFPGHEQEKKKKKTLFWNLGHKHERPA